MSKHKYPYFLAEKQKHSFINITEALEQTFLLVYFSRKNVMVEVVEMLNIDNISLTMCVRACVRAYSRPDTACAARTRAVPQTRRDAAAPPTHDRNAPDRPSAQ